MPEGKRPQKRSQRRRRDDPCPSTAAVCPERSEVDSGGRRQPAVSVGRVTAALGCASLFVAVVGVNGRGAGAYRVVSGLLRVALPAVIKLPGWMWAVV